MAFKLVVLCAALACAHAGGLAPIAQYSLASDVSNSYISTPLAAPVAHAAYAAAPVAAVHAPHYGASSQSVVRSLGGAQTVSHYNKAVDSAFSTVRKYDTRITNDALSVHAAPLGYATAPVLAKTYAAAPVAAYAAPVVAKAYAAPVVAKTYAAPVAPAAYTAPVVAKAAIAYSPAVAVSHATFEGLGVHYEW